MYSLLIKNAQVVDGTGHAPYKADVACEGSRIVNVAPEINVSSQVTIDAGGKVLAPGFIDIQNHSDSYWQLFDNPSLASMVSQGFTTLLVGNCGASLAPLLSRDALLSIQKWHDLDGVNINWQSFAEFAQQMRAMRFGCNIGSLVGYSTLRRGLIGDQVRALDKAELKIMEKNLADALEAGAFGLSTGLSYSHEVIISDLELYALANVVARYKGLFSVHLRSEGSEINESLEEALEIARQTDVNLKISHFKVRGKDNAVHFRHLLELLENENHKGVNVHYDVYPYDTTWQVLFSYLPKWAIEGGRGFLAKHLADPAERTRIQDYLKASGNNFGEIIIASTSSKLNVVGKKLSDVANNLGVPVEEAVLQLVEKGGSEVLVFDRNLDPEHVKELYSHPLAIVATDGGGFSTPEHLSYGSLNPHNRLVHPRCFGTAAKFLSESVGKTLKLEEAVWKLTGLAAKKMGLKNRGQVSTGSFADLVIFDPLRLKDNSELHNPYRFSSGIEYVFVNGQASLVNGKLVNNFTGQFLTRA